MAHLVNKLLLFLLSCTCFIFLFNSSVSAQPLIEKKISITAENKTIPEILSLIETQAGFTFAYTAGVVNDSKKISVTKKNATVREVLDIIFENTVAYKERNKHIILIKLAPSTSTEISKIHGYIIDALSGEKFLTQVYTKRKLAYLQSPTSMDTIYLPLKIRNKN
ncbi:MAG: STN domain-containing protein [Bacteroidetes bacterium]|nr:STN domain-containing protein [Bacteroidota bacterium]